MGIAPDEISGLSQYTRNVRAWSWTKVHRRQVASAQAAEIGPLALCGTICIIAKELRLHRSFRDALPYAFESADG